MLSAAAEEAAKEEDAKEEAYEQLMATLKLMQTYEWQLTAKKLRRSTTYAALKAKSAELENLYRRLL